MTITLYRPKEKKYSSVGWRTRLLLEEKKLKYETRFVILQLKEHLSEEIIKLNPQDGDSVLHEESAILFYINQVYNDIPFLPSEKDKKAFANALVLFHEVMGVFSENMRPIIDYLYSIEEEEEIDPKIVQNYKSVIHKELYRFETVLSIHESPFITGKNVSLVDVSIFPSLAHLVRFGYPLKNYNRLNQFYENFSIRESVKSTWPTGWESFAKPYLK